VHGHIRVWYLILRIRRSRFIIKRLWEGRGIVEGVSLVCRERKRVEGRGGNEEGMQFNIADGNSYLLGI
jgi:hypothetical protein